MKKSIDLEISEEEFLAENLLEITITEKNLKEWCLALCLLKEKLLDEITMLGRQHIILSLDSLIKQSDRAVWKIDGKQKRLVISQTEMDYWLKFFLEIYRDGFLSVNHIDSEAIRLLSKNNLPDARLLLTIRSITCNRLITPTRRSATLTTT